jgi:hypothetical protein
VSEVDDQAGAVTERDDERRAAISARDIPAA